jgi:hypothetical protein
MSTLDSFLHHPIETLEEALRIRRQIDALQKQLSALFANHPPSLDAIPVKSGPATKTGKSTMSAEARERIAAAQRARWAKTNGASTPVAKPGKKKGGLTPEGRARIVAALKARHAAAKKAKD